jgi:hypothetical protein
MNIGETMSSGGTMNNGHTRVLLIEDNPGDADLVRLRLLEGDSAVNVSSVNGFRMGLRPWPRNHLRWSCST